MLFWHAIVAFYLIAYLLTFFPAFYIWHIFGDSLWLRSGRDRFDPQPELAVRVRRGTLWSRACSWGPTGITLIQRLLFGSGGERCDLESTQWSLLAVEVQRGSLCPRGCCSVPARNTAIQRLQLMSEGDHSDPELAVRVRRRSLWSWACCSGPAGNPAI